MTTTKLPDFVTPEYLAGLTLVSGSGKYCEGSECLWGALDRLAGMECTYECPPTASPELHALTMQLQDASDVWRRHIAPIGVRLFSSRGTPAVERARALRIVDWTLREILPDAIDSTVALSGDSEPIRELARMAGELRAAKPVAAIATLADLDALAAIADRADRADLADIATLAAGAAIADLADRAARAALAARAARADLDDRAAIAALAAGAAGAALDALADRAGSEATIWPRIAALLDELLAMSEATP